MCGEAPEASAPTVPQGPKTLSRLTKDLVYTELFALCLLLMKGRFQFTHIIRTENSNVLVSSGLKLICYRMFMNNNSWDGNFFSAGK
jgi:hypothetical protein